MDSKQERWQLIGAALAIVLGILLGLATIPREDPKEVNLDEAAAEITQKAGEHFTKGAIKAVKEELEADD